MSLKSNLAAAVAKVAHPASVERGSTERVGPSAGVPDPFRQLMHRPWRAQPEDTVGGWCITLAEDPRTPADGALAIAMFLSRDVAVHIAEIHNRSLDRPHPGQPDVTLPDQGTRGPQDRPEPPDPGAPAG